MLAYQQGQKAPTNIDFSLNENIEIEFAPVYVACGGDEVDGIDYFKKPTQYWFLNCEPKNNLIFDYNTNR